MIGRTEIVISEEEMVAIMDAHFKALLGTSHTVSAVCHYSHENIIDGEIYVRYEITIDGSKTAAGKILT
jgi:hypothetical protein